MLYRISEYSEMPRTELSPATSVKCIVQSFRNSRERVKTVIEQEKDF